MAWDNYDYECGTCGREFPSGWRARDQHCEATGHKPPPNECFRCERYFRTYNSLFQHMQARNHFQYECYECDETFPDEEERKEHEIDDHFLCAECDRFFQSRHNCLQHLRSRIHLRTNILCPFCSRAFVTATGLTHHVETGSCPCAPNMNREALFRLVSAHDPKGTMSKKLIGWHGDDTYEATERAWNGRGYECYFCHRVFGALKALNQHLRSPVHQQALYHCPNRSCAKDFTILGALMSHLESESCGAMRFDKVQSGVERLIRTGRLLM